MSIGQDPFAPPPPAEPPPGPRGAGRALRAAMAARSAAMSAGPGLPATGGGVWSKPIDVIDAIIGGVGAVLP